jgi:XisI protein
MDTVTKYRGIVRDVLKRYVGIEYANGDIDNELVFDESSDRYAVISVGWTNEPRRSHGCLLHLDIVDGKVWIQRDGTEDGVAPELEKAGIPKEDIVLAWHPPKLRPYTGYAA